MKPAATEELEVICNGEPAGTLRRRRGQLSLTYVDSWRRRDDATPLSLSMPLAAKDHPHRVVEPFLWGLLPDNDAVLARWGRDFQVSVSHPFGLLANVGEDLPGAMQLVRPERVAELQEGAGAGAVTWYDTAEVAEMLRVVSRDHTAWLANIASALAYPDFHPPKVKLAMKVGGYYLLSAVGRTAWVRLAEDLHLDADRLLDRIGDLIGRVVDAFTDAAADPEVAALDSPLPAWLVDAVAVRAAALAL